MLLDPGRRRPDSELFHGQQVFQGEEHVRDVLERVHHRSWRHIFQIHLFNFLYFMRSAETKRNGGMERGISRLQLVQ
jgi:hypothetical protein